MRVGVVSDSHFASGALKNAVDSLLRDGPVDALIHLGDGVSEIDAFSDRFAHIFRVRGNCDGFLNPAPVRQLLTLGGITLFITHGHQYQVKLSYETLLDEARLSGAQAALFGHTHAQHCEWRRSLLLLNPGSCASGHFAALTIEGGGMITPRLY